MSVLFTNVTAVLMDEAGTILQNGYVQVEGTSITYVGTDRPQGDVDRVVDCSGKVMMPGLVNAHTHLPMTLMRGYGGGCDLQTWLHDYIFPAEGKLDPRAVSAGAGLGLAEMIASGVTCVADMYMFTSTIAQEILKSGISANLSCGGVYFGDPSDFNPDTCGDCVAQRALTEEFHGAGDGQILLDASIHGEYTSSAPLWQWMAQFAHDHHHRMHVHVSGAPREHQASLDRHGLTPIQTLNQYGVWDNGGIAAHCVYTTPEDWAIMAEKGVSCVHNPYSNLKLGSGIAPIPDMLQAGVNVALGTDGMSSHNSADLFADLKLAALLPSGVRCTPGVVTPRQALEMATEAGARALGRPTGQIAVGKVAGLILLGFFGSNLTPCHDVVENLVFAAHGSNVVMNMARGNIIYENGTFHTLDVERIQAEVRDYALPLLFH